jgi:hypothetical protein
MWELFYKIWNIIRNGTIPLATEGEKKETKKGLAFIIAVAN